MWTNRGEHGYGKRTSTLTEKGRTHEVQGIEKLFRLIIGIQVYHVVVIVMIAFSNVSTATPNIEVSILVFDVLLIERSHPRPP